MLPLKIITPYSFFLLSLVCLSCGTDTTSNSTAEADDGPPLFTLLTPEQTKVDFQNTLTEGLNTNILMYEYFYNGGGVATGDFNSDGLIDIYFTSNMADNKLYINKGDMQFQDATVASGATGRPGPWKTGVTIVDINGDNRLDLYICYSGMLPDPKRANELYINKGNDANGIPQFEEQATAYGLASAGFSNQAYFFDADKDGDLDMLLLNHNPKSLPVLNEVSTAEFLKKDDPQRGVRLYKQANGRFEDVTTKSGVSGSALTYGLGLGITDINNDGWQDFYISNDYAVPDYLYVNNQNGTFTNKLNESLGHNSHFSMGNDIADINNDGWQDIVTLDMLPEDNRRQKLLLAPDNYNKFDLNVRSGFHYQYMRNMLQLNNGNGTFSEIGQLAGISNTDWSWAALLADYNNDGWKDLFITNGYYRDYTNLDFIKYMDNYVQTKGRLQRTDVLEIIAHMPASNVVNYIFANENGQNFTNKTKNWGLGHPSNSNGAAYADLDNDGDLDLVVNNINQPAFIFQNESQKNLDHNYLQVKLQGESLNTQGIGTKVTLYSNDNTQSLEQVISRGYLSAVSPILHFGLGKSATVDSLIVIWASGKQQILYNAPTNQILTLSEEDATSERKQYASVTDALFEQIASPISYQDPKLTINDFDRQPLLNAALSYSGPCMVRGDVNGDGLEDVFIGGAMGQAASLFVQQSNHSFAKKLIAAFETDQNNHDADAAFFDANGDGHLDIYVASGGYHQFKEGDAALQDRLYLNDGTGNFTKSANALPEMLVSKGAVAVHDVNQDGHLDVFVGGRVVPGSYPEAPRSYLLLNDGTGKFTDKIESVAPELQQFGMITDAAWADLDTDGTEELIVVGEWLPVSIFKLRSGELVNDSPAHFEKKYNGWWNTVEIADINGDQQPDLLVGNIGLNTQFKVSEKEPAEMYFKDFDNNGSIDPIFTFYIQGKSYPYVTRDELLWQLSKFRSRFTSYESYANATLSDIFTEEELKDAGHLEANRMETTLFINQSGTFSPVPLPIQAQYAPVYTMTVLDYNADGNQDILLCGNNSNSKLRLGKFDANYGVLLKGDGQGGFSYVNQMQSGFDLRGDVRSVLQFDNTLLFGVNQKGVVSYRLRKKQSHENLLAN